MLHGIVEESGELADAETEELLLDAVGDIMIYSASYCNHMGWQLQTLWDMRFANIPKRLSGDVSGWRLILKVLGKVSHHHLKAEQKIRGKSDEHRYHGSLQLSGFLGLMQTAAYTRLIDLGATSHPDLAEVAFKIWREEVQPRDWTKKKEESVDAR